MCIRAPSNGENVHASLSPLSFTTSVPIYTAGPIYRRPPPTIIPATPPFLWFPRPPVSPKRGEPLCPAYKTVLHALTRHARTAATRRIHVTRPPPRAPSDRSPSRPSPRSRGNPGPFSFLEEEKNKNHSRCPLARAAGFPPSPSVTRSLYLYLSFAIPAARPYTHVHYPRLYLSLFPSAFPYCLAYTYIYTASSSSSSSLLLL